MKTSLVTVALLLLISANQLLSQNPKGNVSSMRASGSEGTALTITSPSFSDKFINKQNKEILPGKGEIFFVIPFEQGDEVFKISEAVMSDANNKKVKAKTITGESMVFEVRKDSKWRMLEVKGAKGSRGLSFSFWDIDRLPIK